MLIHFLTEFFVEDSLMRGVLVDDGQRVVALHKQISCKKLMMAVVPIGSVRGAEGSKTRTGAAGAQTASGT